MYKNWELKTNWHVGEIFDAITREEVKFSNEKYFKNYTIVITGKPGPTGKSALCHSLNDVGFKAIELAENLDVMSLIEFKDDDNHVFVDRYNEIIFIVLNKYFRRELK